MEQKRKTIYISIIIYLYLALPTLIFMVDWLKWYWAFIFRLMLAYACVKGQILYKRSVFTIVITGIPMATRKADSIQEKCFY